MTPGRIWRRTAIERNGRLALLPDDWSLMDAASGLAIARSPAKKLTITIALSLAS